MNPEIKEKWLEALRSGEYEQGKGALRKKDLDSDTYCCLGVLCDIIAPDDWVQHKDTYEELKFGFMASINGRQADFCETSVLPNHIAKIAELDCNPIIEDADGFGRKNLAVLNDSGFTFEQIASLIEREL